MSFSRERSRGDETTRSRRGRDGGPGSLARRAVREPRARRRRTFSAWRARTDGVRHTSPLPARPRLKTPPVPTILPGFAAIPAHEPGDAPRAPARGPETKASPAVPRARAPTHPNARREPGTLPRADRSARIHHPPN